MRRGEIKERGDLREKKKERECVCDREKRGKEKGNERKVGSIIDGMNV